MRFELAVDITKQKKYENKLIEQNNILLQQETELKGALETKEVLLKEVHHRVKNNLQTISSLLNQQKNLADDPKTAEALHDSMNRVMTMALIHQFIYKTDSLEKINLKEYIADLIRKLTDTYTEQKQFVEIDTEIDEIFFNIDKTIPLALIVNEILSNIFKYAFCDKTIEKQIGKQRIVLSLIKQDNQKIKLFISDNGNGFPENFDPEKSKSLGMYLIKNFAKRQLKGKIKIDSHPGQGVQYEIIFN